ncbi:MAG: long-chain N-acyl amino acid synthase [Pirellulaceae bacterium]
MSCALAVTAMVAPRPLSAIDKDIDVSLARTESDLNGAFSLLYDSYLRAGLVQPNAIEKRLTPFHLQPTTEVLVAKYEGQVVSTMTMAADSSLGLPMESMYPQQVAELRSRSLRLAEMGSLADRRNSPVRFACVFAEMARLVVQVAESREIDALVLASHPRHAKLYARTLGFKQFGDLTSCPYAKGNPAVALLLEFDRVRGTAAYDRLVAERIPYHDLQPTDWPTDTRAYLQALYAQQSQSTSIPTRIAS